MHKTGSTSIQHFLRDQGALVARAGAHVPPGFLIPTLHSDLPLLVLRPEFRWPARLRFPETEHPGWQRAAAGHVRAVADEHGVTVWSHEDLSYVRHDDELERLRDLLGDAPVHVVLYRRDRTAFLRSYREQVLATGFQLSDDPASFAYVGPDSWLADHEALARTYRRGFGKGNVTVLDYDAVVRDEGSVIPSFADLLGVPRPELPDPGPYYLNRSGEQLRLTDAQLAAIRRRAVEQRRP